MGLPRFGVQVLAEEQCMTFPAADRDNSLDAYRPAEIASLVKDVGVAKAGLELQPLLIRAMLAGAFIAFGCLFYIVTISGAEPITGTVRFVGGIAFSVGLILVIVGGAELFTGNALMVMALVDRRIGVGALLRNWGWVFLGNAVGAVLIATLAALSGLLEGDFGTTARNIAEAKISLTPIEAFSRGILCNSLVCLAVWLTFSARTAGGKTIVILLSIAGFVALGFEHSVANFACFRLARWRAPKLASPMSSVTSFLSRSVTSSVVALAWPCPISLPIRSLAPSARATTRPDPPAPARGTGRTHRKRRRQR
jgi:formate/nitrite transporter